MPEILQTRASRAEKRGVGIRISGLQRVFPGGVGAIEGLELTIEAGSFVALLGPSGCGKSTLLRLVAGLDAPDRGTIELDAGRGTSIAYVFQEPALLPWRSVLDNAALPLELSGVSRSEQRERAGSVLARVGLGDALHRMPAELSGGMRMRVSLARALVTQPRLLLLDEPFAALDELTRQKLDDDLRALWLEQRMTVLFVTHAISEAIYLAERALVSTARPLRLVLDHRVDLPVERESILRTTSSFAENMRVLFEALSKGANA